MSKLIVEINLVKPYDKRSSVFEGNITAEISNKKEEEFIIELEKEVRKSIENITTKLQDLCQTK